MSHLEELLFQFYEWQGYVVRRNVKVGRLGHGGWAGELDLVAYEPRTQDLVHLEPSIDALPWSTREKRLGKKFAAGRKYVFSEVFPWLDAKTPLKQIAVVVSRGKERNRVAGADILTLDEITKRVKDRILEEGKMASAAIPEQYDLLRTVQLAICGYYRVL